MVIWGWRTERDTARSRWPGRCCAAARTQGGSGCPAASSTMLRARPAGSSTPCPFTSLSDMHKSIYVCMYVSIYLSIYMCVCVCVCVCVYMYTYIYIYVYRYTYIYIDPCLGLGFGKYRVARTTKMV